MRPNLIGLYLPGAVPKIYMIPFTAELKPNEKDRDLETCFFRGVESPRQWETVHGKFMPGLSKDLWKRPTFQLNFEGARILITLFVYFYLPCFIAYPSNCPNAVQCQSTCPVHCCNRD